MKSEDLKKVLELHRLYLAGCGGGVYADLRDADLRDADLIGADLSGADLRDANLRDADLSSSKLRRADLRCADLSGADLRDADLRDADLRDAELIGANLRDAYLRDADLRYANLSGADLRDADLRDANLSRSKGVLYAQVSWFDHGECGRQLLGIKSQEGVLLYCGCFNGTPEQLSKYIAAGDQRHFNSRTKAMEFVLSCLG